MIGSNVSELSESLPEYQDKIMIVLEKLLNYFPESIREKMILSLDNINLAKIFTSIFDTVTSIFSSAGIILFYVMFILLEYRYFKEKLNLMILDSSKKKNVFEIIEKIKDDIKSYFVIKTFVSF
jgi:predicted PurR-regulated permease PerM